MFTEAEIERMAADMVSGLPPVVSSDQVCERMLVKRRELYRRVSLGEIPALRSTDSGSARLLFPRAGLEDYFRRRLAAGGR